MNNICNFFNDFKRKLGFYTVCLYMRGLERSNMTITKEYLENLEKTLSLIPLSYDRVFKSVFKINLDILKEFLKVSIPTNINDNDSINLLDSEIPVTNKNEYKRTVDILVVINNKIYIDVELNKSKFEYVSDRNFSYGDIISTRVIETGEDINNLKYKYIYQLNLNENPYEDVLEDDIVLYGLKTHKIYNSNRHTLTKSLELYRNLYYNESDRSKEVIWYTMLTSRTFTELYELALKVLEEDKVQRLMEAVINMSKDEFIIHEWQKEKMDALVKHNELEGAKKEGIEEGKIIGIKENKLEIAKNLLNMKTSIEDISKATGLTIQDIQKMQSTED